MFAISSSQQYAVQQQQQRGQRQLEPRTDVCEIFIEKRIQT
jgi:hypothetical protein